MKPIMTAFAKISLYLNIYKPSFIGKSAHKPICSFTAQITCKLYKQPSSGKFHVNSCILHKIRTCSTKENKELNKTT